MKKRILSLFFVFIFVFAGAFSCIASADQSIGERLFNLWFDSQDNFDVFGISKPSRDFMRGYLSDLLFEDENTESENDLVDVLDSSLYGYGRLTNFSSFNSGLRFTNLSDGVAVLPGQALKCTIDPHSQFSIFPHCNNFYAYNLQFYYSDESRHSEWNRYNSWSTSPFIQSNTSDNPMFLYVRYDVISNDDPIDLSSIKVDLSGGIHWGWDLSISWQAQFEDDPLKGLNIDLTSSRALISDDGSFQVSYGVIYRPEDDVTYAGPFVKYDTITTGDEWHYNLNLSEFAYYVYRKHCGLKDFRAFISVRSNKENKCVLFKYYDLDLKPIGIFDDVEDPPDWKDYQPDPSEDPSPPHFDSDFIFNYTTNNTTYQSFNWTTINNYSVIGSGGGGAGGGGDSSSGSGGDSSSGSGDDSSSGGDSSSGSDPGGDGSFNDWFSDAVVTINNNFNTGLDTLNENVRIIKENTENYFEAVHDYIEGYFHDWLEYIAALLKNFRDDFNAWTTAFGDYLSDTFNTVNHNIVVVGDNIVKAIKTQVVPDKDVVYNIASSHFPMVDQLNTVFNEHEVEDKDLIVSIPLFGSDAEPAAYFVQQSFNSDGQLRGGGDSSQSSVSSPINDVSGDCVTFNLSEIFTQYDLPRFRSVGSAFILAATFFSLLNITLKIFGLSFK